SRFDRLLALVAPLLSKQATNADNTISAGERLCAFLRYLAHGSSQLIIAKSYCHSAAFACANVQETSRALRTVLEPLYMPAPTEELWARNAQQFYDLWNFPNCVGAIDGKHITVEARGSATFNYKKTHSIILLAVVDAQYKFVMVDIGEFGSWNDSAVFRSCPIGQNMTSGTLQLPEPQELPHTSVKMPFVLVGDEAFPLMENLMRPYPGTSLTLCEKVYNYRLSRARRIVENAFGILAARWRIFRQIIQAELSTVDNLVWAAVLLHNFLRTCDEEEEAGHARFVYVPPAYVDHEDDSHDVQEGQWRRDLARGKKSHSTFTSVGRVGSNNHSKTVRKVRDTFAAYFCTEFGEVPWQYKAVRRGCRHNTV
ncbi:unnamed protein product, partial [Ixodes persulcatus]